MGVWNPSLCDTLTLPFLQPGQPAAPRVRDSGTPSALNPETSEGVLVFKDPLNGDMLHLKI